MDSTYEQGSQGHYWASSGEEWIIDNTFNTVISSC